ncbi:hypothetical protein [Pseudoalteromonas sp. S16_S37]|uniref:hypothetical protein n=1 Tax=Pseudoalteromonas sp. S16_S37 TaxID=2720228 RepID=UPI00168038C0|nr:hypothetical protein [Pseudoalteromonas sp. S16_S37]MBD1580865.1 hypothetical protein [Pseudoalteromonas sp. S16_S37]
MNADLLSSYLKLLPTSLTYDDEQVNMALVGYLNIFEALLTQSEPVVIEQDSNQSSTLQSSHFQGNLPTQIDGSQSAMRTQSQDEQSKQTVISFGRMIDNASVYSDPDNIPLGLFPELGPWMSRCLGVVAQQDWSYYQQKQIIKNIIPIYRIRTTKSGMEALFGILTGYPAQVIEILGSFGIGFYRQPKIDNKDVYFCSGRLGTVSEQLAQNNMVLGGKMLGSFFIINLTVSASYHGEKRALSLFNRVTNLFLWINEEKPVQTQFQLNYTTTPLQVGARGTCTVGVNTSLEAKKITRTINSWQNCEQVLRQQIATEKTTKEDKE